MNEEISQGLSQPIRIEDEMRKSYMDYAMSVIVSRALPDVRDGLKPVHRRILYAMKEGGFDSTKPFRKSARIVGDVMGKYHPHGDQAIYDAMVRMAQSFSLRLPLVQGQGNFGSIDGDPPAAMRYTEARLAKSAEALLDDISKDTVNFNANYDESTHEPVILPARFPNLLVNGASGIAVGMATNIPPHNLGELLDACVALINNPSITAEELHTIIPGPDFPTGGIMFGRTPLRNAFMTGRGSVITRGKTHIETSSKDRDSIIVTEVPYQVNKARLIERIAEAARGKVIEGIQDIRDESDREGMRIVIEVKRDSMSEVVLQQLYKHTQLQTSFGVNMLALNGGMPELMNVESILRRFLSFRDEVVVRRTKFLLQKARDRAHILAGLLVAINNIDEVIDLIRQAKDPQSAREALMTKAWNAGSVAPFIALINDPDHKIIDGTYKLSLTQAKAILDIRLQRLTGLEQDKLEQETKDLADEIKEFLTILSSYDYRQALIKQELCDIKEQFATPRRTQIEEYEFEQDLEDLIQREDMVVTISHSGYAKRVALATYRAQRRGGKGRSGMSTKEEDFVSNIFVANTHVPLLFFSNEGMAYKLKVYRLPESTPQAKGKALVNLLALSNDERITTILPLPEDEENWSELSVIFVTKGGHVRRNRLSDFSSVRANGKIAMKLPDGEQLVQVCIANDDSDILISSKNGAIIRFRVDKLRIFNSRNSLGVRGIDLKDGDEVVSMSIIYQADYDSEVRRQYIQTARAIERLKNDEYAKSGSEDSLRDKEKALVIPAEQFALMQEKEQFILTVSANGMGQLCSSYDYRTTNRGGKGIQNMDTKANIVASHLVIIEQDDIMLVTDAGQLIRVPVNGIRKTSRASKGVRVFNVANNQFIISCALISGDNSDDEDESDDSLNDTLVANEETASHDDHNTDNINNDTAQDSDMKSDSQIDS